MPAGRDPLRHGTTAGQFDVGRIDKDDKEHLAFGHGVRYCVPGGLLHRGRLRVDSGAPEVSWARTRSAV